MTDPIPPEAITLAAVAIHDVCCPDRTCSGSALGHYYRLARAALEAASPVLRAADAETIARKDRELDGLRRENERIRNELMAKGEVSP